MYEKDTKEMEEEGLKSYHIDLDYLRNKCYNKEKLNALEEMLLLFIVEGFDELRGDIYMELYMQELKRISQDEKIIGLYDAEKVKRKIRNTEINGAKMEGRQEGELQGRKSVAKEMLENDVDISDVAKYTNLSIEELEKITCLCSSCLFIHKFLFLWIFYSKFDFLSFDKCFL